MGQRGHSMHVVTFDARSPANGATLHPIEPRRGKVARAEAVEPVADRLGADIVHDTGVGWTYDVIHPQAGSKMANYRRDLASRPWPQRRLWQLRPARWAWRRDVRELERRQYQQSDGIVLAVSNKVADDLRQLYDISDDRFRFVPNAIDTERFTPARRLALREQARQHYGYRDETVFLFSALNPLLKGTRPLLRAMRRLRNCRLLMIGAEPPTEYRDIDNVTFGGYADDAMFPLAAADAAVHPTYYDACSLTTLEAWSCGLPVITTRFNGASDLMQDGVEGFLLDDPDNDRALEQAMQSLTDPSIREAMAQPARTLALNNNYERYLEKIEAVYRSVP
jgi:UDP-glucose:(heptosyl)LPS alpha-1,3-glucosyltransferase